MMRYSTGTGVVLVVRGDVDGFVVFDVGGCGDNVECVNHRRDLIIRWDHYTTRGMGVPR